MKRIFELSLLAKLFNTKIELLLKFEDIKCKGN